MTVLLKLEILRQDEDAPEISIVTVSQTQDSVKLRNVILHRKMYKFRDLFLNLLNKATQAQHFI